ncbi:MAG: hypothetical protein II155_00255, partial [Clostridia bacterium]|nr:hypothetical protein [Clostridia bacterium]
MTKRLLSAAIAVLLVLSLVPMSVFAKVGDAVKASGETKDAAVYAKVTSASEITEGKYVICAVNGSTTRAMNNTLSNGSMGQTTVTVTDDTITDPANTIVWDLKAQSDGTYALYSEAANQYCYIQGDSGRSMKMGSTSAYFFNVTVNSSTTVTLKTTYSSGRMIYYISSYGFRSYSSSTYSSNIYLYKLQAPAGTEVTYTGETVEVTNPKVNDTFDWTFSVSEAAALSAGTWYIDYDENYLTATAFDYTWEGGLSAQIGDSLDPQSDVFMMSYNLADVVNGNTKLKCMLNLTSFD